VRAAAVLAFALGCGGRGEPRASSPAPVPAARVAEAPDSTSPPRGLSARAPDSISAAAAARTLRDYYAAIESKDLRRAYAKWGGRGAASGKSFDTFARGFAATAHVAADLGAPGPVEGAAGSRYVEIPVVVRAVTTGGERQRFEGRYVLRRSEVDGATPEQRSWRIDSARLRPAP